MSEQKKSFVDPSYTVSTLSTVNLMSTSGWNSSIQEIGEIGTPAEYSDN